MVMAMVMVAACPATTHPCSRRALVDPSVAARLGNTTSRLVAPSAVIDTSRNCRLVVVAGWGEWRMGGGGYVVWVDCTVE
jgi:ABC-type enterobactin transport system permease subunit